MKHYELNMKKLIKLLLCSTQFVTLETLSDQVGISKRSVQNYIGKISDWLAENALTDTCIEKKRGYGIFLNTTDADRNQIERLLNFEHLSIHSGDAKRRHDILKALMFSDDEITIQLLCSQFYVSRATILSDLDWAAQWLAQYKLKLYKTQHRGIGIVGDEVAHRNALAGFFDTNKLGILSDFDASPLLVRFDEKRLRNLVEIYPRDTVLKMARIVEDAERNFDFILLDDFFTALLTHMVISVLRIASGNSVAKEFLPPEETFPPLETQTAEFIARRVKTALGIDLSPAEQAYICIHLVGYNAFSVEMDSNLPFPQKIEHLAISLVELVDRNLSSNYSHDKMLFFGLCLHLKTAVYRLKVTAHTPKALNMTLPDSWSEVYNVLKNSVPIYEQICQVTPDEEELLGVCCFFLLSNRRCNSPIRALLVSNWGILARMEIIDEIESAFPNIKIVDSCSTQQLGEWSTDQYALLITTDPLEHPLVPCVLLQPTSKGGQFQAICDYLNKLSAKE